MLIVQDPFTSYYDASRLLNPLKNLVINLLLYRLSPTVKLEAHKRFLQRFAKTAKNQADYLNSLAKLDLPLVEDPAIVLSYREEYREI